MVQASVMGQTDRAAIDFDRLPLFPYRSSSLFMVTGPPFSIALSSENRYPPKMPLFLYRVSSPLFRRE